MTDQTKTVVIQEAMKTISIILLLACLSLVGCSTVPPNQTAQLAGIAEVAAFTGTAYYLADHPEKAPLFEAAKQALDGLINDGNSDPAAFSKALSALPIKELKGDKGVIVVGAAVILWDTYASQVTTLDQKQKVMPVVIAVRNGLARALVKPQAGAGLNMPRAYVWRGPEPVQGYVGAYQPIYHTTLEYETTENYLLWQNGKLVKH
jgi:hypothetical protein